MAKTTIVAEDWVLMAKNAKNYEKEFAVVQVLDGSEVRFFDTWDAAFKYGESVGNAKMYRKGVGFTHHFA